MFIILASEQVSVKAKSRCLPVTPETVTPEPSPVFHSSCLSVRSGSGTDRRTCPFVRSPPGTYPRFFRPCDRLQELIDGFVGTCQGHYSKAPANVYQPGRKLIMCLSITHTWLRAEASLPARLSLDIQFLIEKSVVTVLLVL